MHDVAKSISNVPTQSTVRPRRRRGLGIAMGLLIAILIFVLGIKALQIGKMMSSPKMMPSVTVTSAPVKEDDCRAVRRAAWYPSGERRTNDQCRSASYRADVAGSVVRRFCVARATPLEIDEGFGSAGTSRRAARTRIQRETDCD